MTNKEWESLKRLVAGTYTGEPLTGFIIDSPWIPGWIGTSHLEFYSSETTWMESYRKILATFPDTMFLPGFWSEFGMCTEPSAFGAKCIWKKDQMPHADKVIHTLTDIEKLKVPDPESDGLLPLMIQRLVTCEPGINDLGHEIRFAIARGPLNIASFLMGTTELMMAIMLNPDEIHALMRKITDFSKAWILHQKAKFPSIEGILLLDDIVGFIGEPEVKTFAVPYIREIFSSFNADIRFFHNDAQGLVSTPFIGEMGVNLYNFSFEHSINEIRALAGKEIAFLGNLPPRDVLAQGSPGQVASETRKMITDVEDPSRIIWSCGGGMPPDVSTENIQAFIETVKATQ